MAIMMMMFENVVAGVVCVRWVCALGRAAPVGGRTNQPATTTSRRGTGAPCTSVSSLCATTVNSSCAPLGRRVTIIGKRWVDKRSEPAGKPWCLACLAWWWWWWDSAVGDSIQVQSCSGEEQQ